MMIIGNGPESENYCHALETVDDVKYGGSIACYCCFFKRRGKSNLDATKPFINLGDAST